MKRTIAVIVVLVISTLALLPVEAQGSLDKAEKQALFERLERARELGDSYTSYVEQEILVGDVSMNLTGLLTMSFSTYINSDMTTTYSYGEVPTALRLMTVEVENAEDDVTEAYTVTAEARRVDAVVYVQATREAEDEFGLDPMPDGWVMAESEWDLPYALDDLELSDLFSDYEEDASEELGGEVLTDLEYFMRAEITMENDVLPDGTPVEVYSISYSDEDLYELLSESPDLLNEDEALTMLLLENLSEGSIFDVAFALDAEDNLRMVEVTIFMELAAIDLSVVDPTLPEGAGVMSMYLDMYSMYEVTDINAPVEPITAPEME
ncbi:MAG: hypothetical protein GYB65_20630 [Chloroflexi bacterium]|nr:hypothetical protein [Chloroflexota bacterium]